MTAKEAKAAAEAAGEIAGVLQDIQRAASRGRFSLEWGSDLSGDTIIKLKLLGYRVLWNERSDCREVSWS